MATITSFEDLEIWKKAQELGAIVYWLCDENPKISKDFSFKDQFSNNNDFWRFLRIAKGSCGEVRNCLLFSIKIKYSSQEEVGNMVEFSRILGCQIGNLMKYLKQYKAEQSRTKQTP